MDRLWISVLRLSDIISLCKCEQFGFVRGYGMGSKVFDPGEFDRIWVDSMGGIGFLDRHERELFYFVVLVEVFHKIQVWSVCCHQTVTFRI
jgi:hypothetical protein